MIGEFSALSSSLVWAAASLMFAALGASTHPVTLNFFKCVIAVLLMVITQLVLSGTVPDMSSSQLIWLSLSGLLGLSIGDTAFFAALNRLGPRRTLLMSALTPAVTALIAIPVLSESVSSTLVLGMALTMFGVVWVIRERTGSRTSATETLATIRVGVAFALLNVACQAGGNILTKLGAGESSALEISIIRLLAGIAGLIVVLAFRPQFIVGIRTWSSKDRWMLVAATFLGTYLGIWLMNAGLKYTHTAVATTLNSTSPIFILPLAYFVLKEKISGRAILGALVATAGVALLFLQDLL